MSEKGSESRVDVTRKEPRSREFISGDEIYLSLGFSPISDVTSSVFFVPPATDGPVVAGYRLEITLAGQEEPVTRIIPFDDYVSLINSLIRASSPEILQRFPKKIITFNYEKEALLRMVDRAQEHLVLLRRFIDEMIHMEDTTKSGPEATPPPTSTGEPSGDPSR